MRRLAKTLIGAAVALPIAIAAPITASAQKACGPCAPKAAKKSCGAAKATCGAKAKCGPKEKCAAAKKRTPCGPAKSK